MESKSIIFFKLMELKSKKWKQTIVKWIIWNDELKQINV